MADIVVGAPVKNNDLYDRKEVIKLI